MTAKAKINEEPLRVSSGLVLARERNPSVFTNFGFYNLRFAGGCVNRKSHIANFRRTKPSGASFCSGLVDDETVPAAAKIEHPPRLRLLGKHLAVGCCRSSRNHCKPAARRKILFSVEVSSSVSCIMFWFAFRSGYCSDTIIRRPQRATQSAFRRRPGPSPRWNRREFAAAVFEAA